MPIVYFTLPFAAEDKNTKTKLSNDMELAAIICASETEHIRSKAPDYAKKLTFVSRLHYPIWAISQGKNCFLLDGMRFVTGNIPLLKPPDPEALIDDLKKNTKDQDQFLRTLQRERETFKGFSSRKRISIPGYIDDKQMLTDIMSFLKDAKTSTSSSATQSDSFIRPKMDQENAIRVTNGISEHYDTLQSEIKGLQYAKEVIIQETQIHTHRLQQELREMQEDFSQQIARLTEKVNGKIVQLESERDSEIVRMATENDKRTHETLVEKQELEKQLLRLEQDKNEYEKRKDLRRSKKDEPGEVRWKVRLENVKRQISDVRRKAKSLSNLLSNTQKEIEKTTKKMRESYTRLINLEKEKIEALEKSQDLEIKEKSKRINDLQQNTLILTHNIEAQIGQIRLALAEFEYAKTQWEIEAPTLIGIPIYIVGQKVENENRYLLFPPVIVHEHKGLGMTISTTLGVSGFGSRIKSILRPRSKSFEKLFNSLRKELEKDEAFEVTVNQIATSKNLITLPEFQERLRNGLKQLEDEGWIKPEERDAILSQRAS